MAKIKGAVVVNTERCKGCNLCVVACPSDVLELHPREVNNKGYHYVYMKNPDDCIGWCKLRVGLSGRLFDHLQEEN